MASKPIPININTNNPSSLINGILNAKPGSSAGFSSQTSRTGPDQDALEMELDAARVANTNYIDTLNMAREMVNAKNYKSLVMNNIAMGNDPLNSSLTRQVESYANNRTGTTSPEEGLFGPNVMTVAPEREAPMFDPSKMVMPKVPQITESDQSSVRAATAKPTGSGTKTPITAKSFLGLPSFAAGSSLLPNDDGKHDTPSATAIRYVGFQPDALANTANLILEKNSISPDKGLQVKYMGQQTGSFADLYALAWMKGIKDQLIAQKRLDPSKPITQQMNNLGSNPIEIAPGIYVKPALIAQGDLDAGLSYDPSRMYKKGGDPNKPNDYQLDGSAGRVIDTVLGNAVMSSATKKELANGMKKVVDVGWKSSGTDPNTGQQKKFDWVANPSEQAADLLKAGMLYGLLVNDSSPGRTGVFRTSTNKAKHQQYWNDAYGK